MAAKIEQPIRRGDFLAYERCSTRELRRFCNQRGIVVGDRRERARPKMIDRPRRKDARATFDCFASLPPDLRRMVYEEHFASFPTVGIPTAPPLCSVSRWMREESLALFFPKLHRATATPHPPLRPLPADAEALLSLEPGLPRHWAFKSTRHSARELLAQAPGYIQHNVRNFRLQGGIFNHRPFGMKITWEATFSPRTNAVRVVMVEVDAVVYDAVEWADYWAKSREKHGACIVAGLRALLGRDVMAGRVQGPA